MQRASGVVVVIMCVWWGSEVDTYLSVINVYNKCVNELCVKVTGCEVGVWGVWGVGVGSV